VQRRSRLRYDSVADNGDLEKWLSADILCAILKDCLISSENVLE
jgi:hypothetical protein